MRNKPINQWGDECLRSILYDILITLLEYKWTELACEPTMSRRQHAKGDKVLDIQIVSAFSWVMWLYFSGTMPNCYIYSWWQNSVHFSFFFETLTWFKCFAVSLNFAGPLKSATTIASCNPWLKKNQPLYSVASWLTGAHHDEHMDHA